MTWQCETHKGKKGFPNCYGCAKAKYMNKGLPFATIREVEWVKEK